MTFEPLSDHFPNIPVPSVPPVPSAPSLPSSLLLSDIPTTPLTWLWPARIPLGQLTLLDAAPGCNPSLFALTLAASISSGTPLPDGTPATQGNVILFAPYDSASSILKPRLQAAGGDPAHVLLFRPNTLTELAQQTNCAILLTPAPSCSPPTIPSAHRPPSSPTSPTFPPMASPPSSFSVNTTAPT